MPDPMIGQFANDEEMCSRCSIRLALSYRRMCLECCLDILPPETMHKLAVYLMAGWRVNEAGYPRRVYWLSLKDCE